MGTYKCSPKCVGGIRDEDFKGRIRGLLVERGMLGESTDAHLVRGPVGPRLPCATKTGGYNGLNHETEMKPRKRLTQIMNREHNHRQKCI